LGDNKILSERELEARFDIRNEIFVKKVQIEARILGDLAINHIIPTAIAYQNVIITNIKGLKDIFPVEKEFKSMAENQIETLKTLSLHINAVRELVPLMDETRKELNLIDEFPKRAQEYSIKVKPFLEEIRTHIDKLELIVDDEMWPLPKYRELLFIR